MVTLSHYCEYPIVLDRTRAYDQSLENGRPLYKPLGVWVSVDGEDDWAQWCLQEDFCPSRLACRHEVRLASEEAILWLDTPQSVLDFHAEYAEESELDRHFARSYPDMSVRSRQRDWRVNWMRVADKYDGVIIAPYHWSLRMMGPMWFYGWDCASGCIWNLDAIESFTYAPFKALTS